jgi:hypothetical protein
MYVVLSGNEEFLGGSNVCVFDKMQSKSSKDADICMRKLERCG